MRLMLAGKVATSSLDQLSNNRSNERLETFSQIVAIIRNICPVLTETYSFPEMLDIFSRFSNNAFSILDEDQTCLGVALYPKIASAVNHSCLPNTIVSFDDNARFFLRANRVIEAGEEIEITYLADMTKDDLKEGLGNQYCFLCSCNLCKSVFQTCLTTIRTLIIESLSRLRMGNLASIV
jgi:hypothetical protein